MTPSGPALVSPHKRRLLSLPSPHTSLEISIASFHKRLFIAIQLIAHSYFQKCMHTKLDLWNVLDIKVEGGPPSRGEMASQNRQHSVRWAPPYNRNFYPG